MGSRANVIGGTHLHKWIFLFDSKYTKHPYKAAQKALEKIERNTLILHALLTVDVIFLDKAGQISAQQVAIMDIILQKV